MISIKEFQYEINNPQNNQSRIVQCSSWTEYLNALLCGNNILTYPSIPRNSRIKEIINIEENAITCRFHHWKIGEMIHIAIVE